MFQVMLFKGSPPYKDPTIVIYVSGVVNISNLLVSMTRVFIYARRGFIRLATGLQGVFMDNRWSVCTTFPYSSWLY